MSQSIEDDEIDLRELFAALISGWFTIGVSTAIALVLSIVYAFFIAEEKYESMSVFALDDSKSSSLPAGLGGLAGLAGLRRWRGFNCPAAAPLNSSRFRRCSSLKKSLHVFLPMKT